MRLEDINSVVHIKIALAFHSDGEFVIDEVKENVCSMFIGGSDRKVVDMLFEEGTFAVDDTRV